MITLTNNSPVPPYEQIRTQLRTQIVNGDLLVGSRLPTVRRLAADLGVAPNTVGRAYRELEEAGLVETNRRRGTIVLADDDALRAHTHADTLSYVRRMRDYGMTVDDTIAVVRIAYQGLPE